MWYGVDGDFTAFVSELLGPNLEDLFVACGRRFSLKTTLMLADQMISRIEWVHSQSFIHRDIRPDNFFVGVGETQQNVVYLSHFALSKKFIDPRVVHQYWIKGKPPTRFTGTPRYASINALCDVEQCFRDDIESLGYVLIYFLKGSLPWQSLKASSKVLSKAEWLATIRERKISTSAEELCKNCPKEFETFVQYARNMRFLTKPDYGFLRRLFGDLFDRCGFTRDFGFDWVGLKDSRSAVGSSVERLHEEFASMETRERRAEGVSRPLAGRSSVGSVVAADGSLAKRRGKKEVSKGIRKGDDKRK